MNLAIALLKDRIHFHFVNQTLNKQPHEKHIQTFEY